MYFSILQRAAYVTFYTSYQNPTILYIINRKIYEVNLILYITTIFHI